MYYGKSLNGGMKKFSGYIREGTLEIRDGNVWQLENELQN